MQHHERHTLVGRILQDVTTLHFGQALQEISQAELDAAKKSAEWTVKIEDLLRSGAAVTGATLIPDGEKYRTQLIALVDGVNGTLQHALTTGDKIGFDGTLAMLGANLSKTLHDPAESGISRWLHIFETVISFVLPLLKH